ncbi:MAG: carbonic anhydrase [Raineya sp.]|nr:carbonic anhydrase [Raineya sp.]
MKKLLLVSLLLIITLTTCRQKNYEKGQSALERLIEGNQRFVKGDFIAPNRTEERRLQTLAGQNPFAAILTCSDSRISPTLFFDTGIGDLFIVRTAGNVIGEIEIASLEYAVKYLGVQLVMVMGHDDCGAIKAFITGAHEEGHIQAIIDSLRNEPEEKEALRTPKSIRLNSCVLANVTHQAKFLLQNSKIIAEKVREGKLQVVEAEYEHKSGLVKILRIYPQKI